MIADYIEGKEVSPEMLEMALARIRQLSCHEVGHTLGLGHNYASSVNDRASVMDYPHPLIKIKKDGSLDLSDAYDTGVGEWDKVSIDYGYQHFPDGVDEEKELRAILDGAFSRGLYFLASQDARPSSAHPLANVWDNIRSWLKWNRKPSLTHRKEHPCRLFFLIIGYFNNEFKYFLSVFGKHR